MAENTRMFMFTHAGGNPWDYAKLFKSLKGVELIPITLPGDVTNLHSKVLSSVEEYAEEAYKIITTQYGIEKPFILFGHSFGSYVSYELAKKLQTERLKLVILSGCSPLHINVDINLNNIELLEKQNNEELNKIIETINHNILSQVKLVSRYRLEKYGMKSKIVNNKTKCCVLCGLKDPFAKNNEEWKEYFSKGKCKVEFFEGGHFYWNEYEKSKKNMIDTVQREIEMI